MNFLVSVAEYAGFTSLDAGDKVSRDKAFILACHVPVYEKQLKTKISKFSLFFN